MAIEQSSAGWNQIEFAQEEHDSAVEDARTESIKRAIERSSKALRMGQRKYYRYVATQLDEILIPKLFEDVERSPESYSDKLGDHDRWNHDALRAFIDQREQLLARLSPDAQEQPGGQLRVTSDGGEPQLIEATDLVESAFLACTAVAENESIIRESYDNRADAMGFATKLGVQRQKPSMNFGDLVEAIVDERGTVKSLFTAETGSGKTTGAERQFEDYYWRNKTSAPACKCIDLVDFTSAENIFYDLEQQQPSLRHAREQMDLPPGFGDLLPAENLGDMAIRPPEDAEADVLVRDRFAPRPDPEAIVAERPEMEVYVPLSEEIRSEKLPYDTETEEFVATPFIIPASEISRELFLTYTSARLSKTEQTVLREAFEAVDRRIADWAIADIAEEVRTRDELSDKQQTTVRLALESLQDMSFIRRRRDNPELTLNWPEIFRSTDVITVFNQSLTKNETEAVFVLAWLLEEIWEERTSTALYPQAAYLFRELWEYAPHRERDSDTPEESVLQSRIGTILTRMLRKNRDIRSHFVCDTQQLMDINKGVREMMNRYVVLDGDDTVYQNIFSWTSNSKWKTFKGTITSRTGEAGIVGLVGPAVSASFPGIEFISPVKLAPPSFHHHDKDEGNGWAKRADYIAHEELRKPDWPFELPEDLDVGEAIRKADEESGIDPSATDPKDLHRAEARNRARNGESIRQIQANIPDNPEYGKPYSTSTIHGWIEDVTPVDSTDSSGVSAD